MTNPNQAEVEHLAQVELWNWVYDMCQIVTDTRKQADKETARIWSSMESLLASTRAEALAEGELRGRVHGERELLEAQVALYEKFSHPVTLQDIKDHLAALASDAEMDSYLSAQPTKGEPDANA